MADLKPFARKIFPWETGVPIEKAHLVKMVKDSVDPGGHTKFGITLSTWQTLGYDKDGDGDIDENDLAQLTVDDYQAIVKRVWYKCRADLITSQSIAEIFVDWVWASGYYAILEMQKLLGVEADGIMGSKTLQAIEAHPEPSVLHSTIYIRRLVYIERIVQNSIRKYLEEHPNAQRDELKRATLLKFQQGWENRINTLYKTFES